jgi:hypothetical protein
MLPHSFQWLQIQELSIELLHNFTMILACEDILLGLFIEIDESVNNALNS